MSWVATAIVGGAVVGAVGSGMAAKKSAKASKDAAQIQADASLEAQKQLVELNQPYIDLGKESIPGFQGIINDPRYNTFETLQNDPYGYNYLANNPLFNAAIDSNARQLKGTAAARGKYNSGGLVDALFQNYLATGDQFYGNYLQRSDNLAGTAYNRAYLPVTLGQNAATLTGVNTANLMTGAGNALAAGQIGSANAYSSGINNVLGLGSQVLGYGINSGWFNQTPPVLNMPAGSEFGYGGAFDGSF